MYRSTLSQTSISLVDLWHCHSLLRLFRLCGAQALSLTLCIMLLSCIVFFRDRHGVRFDVTVGCFLISNLRRLRV